MIAFSAARCCFVSLHPTMRRAGIPCPRAPTAAVLAAPRRWGTRGPPRRDSSSWDDGSGDFESDDRIDADFFGPEDDDEEPEQYEPPQPTTRAASPEPQLRGSDVLRALQRAVAAKEAKKKKDKKPPAARLRQGKDSKLKGGGEVAGDGEVRPVVVKPEWAARIRELERRVKQLADKYDH